MGCFCCTSRLFIPATSTMKRRFHSAPLSHRRQKTVEVTVTLLFGNQIPKISGSGTRCCSMQSSMTSNPSIFVGFKVRLEGHQKWKYNITVGTRVLEYSEYVPSSKSMVTTSKYERVHCRVLKNSTIPIVHVQLGDIEVVLLLCPVHCSKP